MRTVAAADLRALVDGPVSGRRALGAYAAEGGARYLFLGSSGVEVVATEYGEQRSVRSLAARHPMFDWDEREMRQDHAVDVVGQPISSPLYAVDGRMPEAFVADGEGLTRVVVGPVHAGIIEPGRFTFSSGGETVVHLDAQLGYSRRGVERALRGSDAVAAAPRVARICGGCSASRSWAYASALESAAGHESSEAVRLARTIVAELERIHNHLGDLAAGASAAGWSRGFALGMTLKEEAMRVNAVAAGHRLLFDAIVPGGIADAVLADRLTFGRVLAALHARCRRYAAELFDNASVTSRWQGTGIVPHATAEAFGATGPAARASGDVWDVRIAAPYGAYRTFEPKIARAVEGDAFARFRVKRAELFESLRMAAAALHELGGAGLPQRAAIRPAAGSCAFAVEGPRGAEIVVVELGEGASIDRFHAISASYRNWPLVARAMDGNIVPDFPLVNKSFNLCYACADR